MASTASPAIHFVVRGPIPSATVDPHESPVTSLAMSSWILECHFYFATVDAENRPRMRPFGPALSHPSHLRFATHWEKNVYAEILENPYIETCSHNPKEGAWVRVSGKAVIVNERAVKQTIFKVLPTIVNIYKTPDIQSLVRRRSGGLLQLRSPECWTFAHHRS
jgi:uncharacterized pyridoxamine 5'-phosphate oxidase family protein